MKINKKGGGLYYKWVEIFAVILMIIGILISLLGDSALINYIMIALSGFVVGRFYFLKKKFISFPFYFAIIGYLIGFTLGAFFRSRGNPVVIIIIYLAFIIIGKHVYKKKWLRH